VVAVAGEEARDGAEVRSSDVVVAGELPGYALDKPVETKD
jgi:hypothetical protein